MKYWKFAVLLSFIPLFLGCATTHAKVLPVPPPQPPQLQHNRPPGFWENKQAVVQVKTIFTVTLTLPDGSVNPMDVNGLGTGLVRDVNGVVITNNHVIALTTDELANMFGPFMQFITSITSVSSVCTVVKGIQYCGPAKVVATDPAHDLAKLYTHQRFPRAVKLVDNSELVAGDELYFWGNVALLLPLSPFFGNYIGSIEPPYTAKDVMVTILSPLLLIDSASFPGSSGAPVFDGLGRCIGLIVGSYPGQPGPRPVSMVIPSSTIMKFDKENPYPLPEK